MDWRQPTRAPPSRPQTKSSPLLLHLIRLIRQGFNERADDRMLGE